MHVFGPLERYPAADSRSYTPREAPLAAYQAMAATGGLQRLVVVQPSGYGLDNRCTLDAMSESAGRARGVVAFDPRCTRDDLDRLHRLGVRGVRLNFASVGTRNAADMSSAFATAARAIGPLGWHIQLFTDLPGLEGIASDIRRSPVPVVIDHMGLAKAEAGTRQPGFALLQELLASGICWVKLSGAYRVSAMKTGFTDVAPIAQALLEANPRRAVWGSDWPHTAPHAGKTRTEAPAIEFRPIDGGCLMELLHRWVDDVDALTNILVHNPSMLYEF
jgi:predicted TIM-barrel fold metal-dependent hydrolase